MLSKSFGGFNGATTFQPWKWAEDQAKSMKLLRFNGATTFQPWKSIHTFSLSEFDIELQWGHDFSAVEINDWKIVISSDDKLQWGHDFSAVEI